MAPVKLETWIAEVAPAVSATGGRPAAGPTYRNVLAKDGYFTPPGCSTLYDIFKASATKYADNNCLGRRAGPNNEFVFETYAQIAKKVTDAASGLRAQGLGAHDKVGIYGMNCPEWMVAMQACNSQSIYCVPLYDTLGADAIEYIANHAECGAVFSSGENLKAFAKALPKCGTVKTVVYWGAPGAAEIEACKEKANVFSLEEFLALGEASPSEPVPPKPEDYCTIMYTSGTTGDPKGVLITHTAVVHMIGSSIKFLDTCNFRLTDTDVFLSYLPLAHIFDRVMEGALEFYFKT